MKRRNEKWIKEKALRRLREKYEQLRVESYNVELVERKKPRFAGWDISLELTEGGKIRKDALEILEVLTILNLDRVVFTRDIATIKEVRRVKYSLNSFKHYAFNNRHISNKTYHNLSERLKTLFYPDYFNKYSTPDKPRYRVYDGHFPWYACRLRVRKAYYRYDVIPNSIAQSEYDKIAYYPDIVSTYSSTGYRDDFRASTKSAWKAALKEVVKEQMGEEELLDYKYPKCFDKKDFGWD